MTGDGKGDSRGSDKRQDSVVFWQPPTADLVGAGYERKRGKVYSTGWVRSTKALGHSAGSIAKPLLETKPLGVMSIRIM